MKTRKRYPREAQIRYKLKRYSPHDYRRVRRQAKDQIIAMWKAQGDY